MCMYVCMWVCVRERETDRQTEVDTSGVIVIVKENKISKVNSNSG